MFSGYDILCFGPTDWWYMNPSCTVHIMRRMAVHNRVLYINPFSADVPTGLSHGVQRRVIRKCKSILCMLRRDGATVHTFSPLFIPIQSHRTVDWVNNVALRMQIRAVCELLHMRPTVLWFENPRAAEALDWFSGACTVYHVSDSFGDCPYVRHIEPLRARERRLTRACDLVICVSRPLFETKRAQRNGTVHYLPHGVDYERFAAAASAGQRSRWLRDIPRPIAGYCGTLTAQNDIALLEWCARHAPTISFVFAGTITAGDYGALRAMENVYFVGQVPYSDVAGLTAGFDVCLLPWRMTPWIMCCNPLKLLEYMAAGRPIVSVPIPQVRECAANLISYGATPEGFLAALQWELQNDTPQRAIQRQAVAEAQSWAEHVGTLSALMEDTIRRVARGASARR